MALRNTIITILVLLALAAFGYRIFFKDGVNLEEKTGSIFTGVVTCLPHTDTSSPQTLECALGLKTERAHYALDVSRLQQTRTSSPVLSTYENQNVSVVGTLTPRELLGSGSSLLKYDIEGAIQVERIDPATSAGDALQSFPGGMVWFELPQDFGLAVNASQVLVSSVIPPCTEGFDYCLYYNDPRWAGTNFESAGVRMNARPDLAGRETCLHTPPEGYASLAPETNDEDAYASALYEPLGDAGVGHYSQGSLYRVFYGTSCYEFETRIGESQFSNFEPGTIGEFDDEGRALVEERLEAVIRAIRSDTGITFFAPMS